MPVPAFLCHFVSRIASQSNLKESEVTHLTLWKVVPAITYRPTKSSINPIIPWQSIQTSNVWVSVNITYKLLNTSANNCQAVREAAVASTIYRFNILTLDQLLDSDATLVLMV